MVGERVAKFSSRIGCELKPLRRIPGERTLKPLVDTGRDVGAMAARQLKVPSLWLVPHDVRWRTKRKPPRQHQVRGNGQRPQITLRARERPSHEIVWIHERGRASEARRQPPVLRCAIHVPHCQAEIDDLDVGVVASSAREQILWLDVAPRLRAPGEGESLLTSPFRPRGRCALDARNTI